MIAPLLRPRPRLALTRCLVLLCDFASVDWDTYHADGEQEWLVPYDGLLKTTLNQHLADLPRTAPVLELGCGTSSLAAQLHADGWSDVLAVDLSRTAVDAAGARHSAPGLRFAVADARDLSPVVPDGSVAAILDKGTLDAICCGDGFDYEAGRVGASLTRALRPGGVWCCVSLMPPGLVLPLLQREEWAELQSTPFGDRLHFYVGRTRADTPTTAGTAKSAAGVGAAAAAAVGTVAPASSVELSACQPTTVMELGSTLAAMGDESAGPLEWVANNFALETSALALVALALVKVATTETAFDVKKRKELEAREKRR
tara:strand:- start:124 stop:1068 length:945 start_codon:yes stop_codon:yes gene_type:complete